MFSELIEKIAASLDNEGINYMLIGGQAVLLYGETRFTRDIDVTLDLVPENLDTIIKIIDRQEWKILVDSPEQFVSETMVLPCVEESTGVRIDFIFSTSAYEKQAFERVNRIKIGETQVCFASPEDLIIHKIIAGRPRDIEDVKSILIKNREIDVAYIREWLGKLGEALSQSLLDTFQAVLRRQTY